MTGLIARKKIIFYILLLHFRSNFVRKISIDRSQNSLRTCWDETIIKVEFKGKSLHILFFFSVFAWNNLQAEFIVPYNLPEYIFLNNIGRFALLVWRSITLCGCVLSEQAITKSSGVSLCKPTFSIWILYSINFMLPSFQEWVQPFWLFTSNYPNN